MNKIDADRTLCSSLCYTCSCEAFLYVLYNAKKGVVLEVILLTFSEGNKVTPVTKLAKHLHSLAMGLGLLLLLFCVVRLVSSISQVGAVAECSKNSLVTCSSTL